MSPPPFVFDYMELRMAIASIHLERNRIVVKGYVTEKCPGWLPNYLRVFDNKTKKYDKDKTYSYLLPNGNIIFPRTTDIRQIVQKLHSQGYDIDGIVDESNNDIIEFRNFKNKIELKDNIKPKDQFQVEAVHFLTRGFQNNNHYRLLSLPTGGGKTFCALAAMCQYGRKTLIVANQLASQWVNEIFDKTTAHYTRIYEIKDGIDSLEKLLKPSTHPESYDIFVASLKTLINSVESGMYLKFCEKFGIGLKIVDEIHLATYSNVYLDMVAPIQETLYLSATPARSNPAEDWCLKKAFANLNQYGKEVKAFKPKHLNTIYVFYDTHPKYYEIRECQNWYGFQTKKFANHILSKPQNLEIIQNILKWAIETTIPAIGEDEKIAIILELKQHIKMLQKWLTAEFPDLKVGDYSSNVEKEVKQQMLKSKIILTTENSFGTGADLKDTLRVLINTTSFNSKVTAEQLPGRLRNIPGRKVYYIDLVDKGFKRTYEHYLNRSKVINSYSLTVQKRTYGVDI